MEKEEENSMVYQPHSEKNKRTLTIAQVNDPVRLDYGPLYSVTGRALEKILPMQDPPIQDQSYGPGYQALWGAANHDAIRKQGDEMHDQSGINPKPGDPPSFAGSFLQGARNSGKEDLKKIDRTAILGGYIADQITGKGDQRTRARLDAAKAERQGREQNKPIQGHEILVEGDPTQSILNFQRFAGETFGEQAYDVVAEAVAGRLNPLINALAGASLDTGDNFAEIYNKTGELKPGSAMAFGVPGGVMGAIPIKVTPPGTRKTWGDRAKEAAAETGKNQTRSLLKDAAVLDNTKGEQWMTEERKTELLNDFLNKVFYYDYYGGR